MTNEELLQHVTRLSNRASDSATIVGVYAQVCEFLRSFAGPKSSFLETLTKYDPNVVGPNLASRNTVLVLHSYSDYIKAGLGSALSPERRAQLDVVSDFLEMAQTLLATKGIHPAAPAVIIGASLEEFLRTWVESESLPMGGRKPAMESYSQVLREADLITKQDGKDITSWAGVRNHAAHGEWADVGGNERVSLMLEGVNLFMRKYS